MAIFATAALHAQPRLVSPTLDAQPNFVAEPLIRAAAQSAVASDGRLDQVLRRSRSEGAWKDMSRRVYMYDGALRTEERQYSFNEGVQENESRTLYTYDGQRLATSIYEWWDAESEAFIPQDRQRFFYQGNSHIATDTHYDEWDSEKNEFVPIERQTYVFANIGGMSVITEGENMMWDDGAWLPLDRFTMEQEGEDVVYTDHEWDGAAWQHVQRSIYADLTIVELYSQLEELLQGVEELPDAYLNLVIPDATVEDWDGSAWIPISRQVTETFYDTLSGLVARQITDYDTWDEDEWITESRRVTVFEVADEKARPDTLYVDAAADDEWMTVLRETYDYDDAGRLQHIYLDMSLGMGLSPWTWTTLFWTGTGTGADDDPLTNRFTLDPAYPNPFNRATTIGFSLHTPGDVTVDVFDVLGRQVATLARGSYPAGAHALRFEAGHLTSGTYIVRLESNGVTQSRTITLVK